MIEEAILARATASSGLTELIGTSPVRFHPQMLPQSPTYPAVTFTRISAPRETAMGSDPGIVMSRWQMSAWAASYISARNVAEQLRVAFQRWRGTVSGVEILDTFLEDHNDLPAELVNDVLIRQIAVDFKIIYRE